MVAGNILRSFVIYYYVSFVFEEKKDATVLLATDRSNAVILVLLFLYVIWSRCLLSYLVLPILLFTL